MQLTLNYWVNVQRDGCANEDCNECNYCAKIAKKALHGNRTRERVVSTNISKILTEIKKI